MDACWSNERCFQKELQMFEREKREKLEEKKARLYTGNLLYLSSDRNAEMFLLKQREKHFQYSNENAVAVPINCAAGFVLEQV